jgi:enoyl-CoA hydratase
VKYKHVIYEKEGPIARIIMNKPEKLNAYVFFGGEDAKEMWAAFDEAAEDDEVKVVIWKGMGRAFSVGHDLSKVGFVYGFGTGKPGEKRPSQRIRLKLDRQGTNASMRVFLHPKITIAQVHGYCLAGGLWNAMLCDMIVASEDAQLGLTEQRMGFGGSGVQVAHLIQTVGLKRALDLLLTGRIISGKKAEEIGLVSYVVPSERLEEETEKLAQAMALYPADGIALGKATRNLVYDALGLTASFDLAYVSHTMFTNLSFEPGEYNFFKERRDKGTGAAYKGRDERYAGLV